MLGERATAERIVEVRRGLGLDQPLPSSISSISRTFSPAIWAVQSTPTRASSRSLSQRFPATIELSLTALCLAGVIGVLAGIVSATHHYSVLDSSFMLLSLAGISMPIFWLGLMMIWTFAVLLGWFPPSGRLDARLYLDSDSAVLPP